MESKVTLKGRGEQRTGLLKWEEGGDEGQVASPVIREKRTGEIDGTRLKQ